MLYGTREKNNRQYITSDFFKVRKSVGLESDTDLSSNISGSRNFYGSFLKQISIHKLGSKVTSRNMDMWVTGQKSG